MLSEDFKDLPNLPQADRLNPCFNGICSLSLPDELVYKDPAGLNPCFNGICSLREVPLIQAQTNACLNPCFNGICSLSSRRRSSPERRLRRLNPCFNGICSLRSGKLLRG